MILPEGLTTISNDLFYSCTSLTNVTIPSTVTSIGSYAFANCSKITSITIPSSVTSIGNSAFSGCYNIDNVYITDLSAWCNIKFVGYSSNPLVNAEKLYLNGNEVSVLTISSEIECINDYAFYGFDGITSLNIPEGVKSIGSYVFYNCRNIASVTVPSTLQSIGQNSFLNCNSLASVYIKDLAAWCCIDFAYSSSNPLVNGAQLYNNNTLITTFDAPVALTKINSYAFYGYSGLTTVNINNNVTSVGDFAFSECNSLTNVTISNKVNNIGNKAFSSCSKLISISVDSNNKYYKSIDGDLYSKDGTRLLQYSIAKSSDLFIIPEEVTSISQNAFSGSSNLTKVVVHSNVSEIGFAAFSSCNNLVIYCEVNSEQEGWSYNWNSFKLPVIYCYTGEEYQYTLILNNGENDEYIVSSYAIELPVLSKTGWEFIGWYEDSNFTGNPIETKYYSSINHTLYAKWISEDELYAGTSFERAFTINLGDRVTAVIDEPGEYIYYKFTALTSCKYNFYSSGSQDTYGYIYDINQNLLKSNDDADDDDEDFDIYINLSEGETVYLVVKLYSKDDIGSFTVKVI